MGMSFIGSYSGIDQDTIDQLMEAERIPLKQLESKKTSITAKQDAWKDINTRLNSLFEKMKALGKGSTFNTKSAVSSDDKYVTMSAGTSAADGKYNIKVDQLASNSNLIGGHIKIDGAEADANAFLGGAIDGEARSEGLIGKFKIINDDETPIEATIDINGDDSLRDIVEKINLTTKETNISATIVDNRIVLNDEKTGSRNITLESLDQNGDLDKEGSVLKTIGFDVEVVDGLKTGKLSEKNGQQAIFHLNGIEIKRDTNTISDAVEGVTINLNKTHDKNDPNQLDVVNVISDTEKTAQAVQDFVDQYNSTMKFIEEKTVAGDPNVAGSKGVLSGEGSLMRLQSNLRRKVTDAFGDIDKDGLNTASKLGISTEDRFGELKFDKRKFLEELSKSKEDVMNFFRNEVEDENGNKVDKGLVGRVNEYVDSFISKKDGLIKSQTESFQNSLKNLNDRIERFEERMVRKEQYYVRTFTALDVAMMKAEEQMNWLAGQVNAMNGGQ